MSADLYLELNDGAHHLGDIAFNDAIASILHRWAAGEDFPVNLVGARTGGTSTYQSSEISAFTFRRSS